MLGVFISLLATYTIIKLYRDYNKIIRYNNQILELKTEVIKINLICETLELSKINIDYDIISKKYIYFPLIIILINILLIITSIISLNYYSSNSIYDITASLIILSFMLNYLPFIIIISLTIILIIIYILCYKINKINDNMIRSKKNEINKKYINNLLILLDNSNDINNINLHIDEYISNYSYLNNNIALLILNNINLNTKKNKRILIIELEQKLIQKKHNELMDIMNTKLKTYSEITQEIVKYELDDFNIKIDEYKKLLLLKITAINELSHINSIIINIS